MDAPAGSRVSCLQLLMGYAHHVTLYNQVDPRNTDLYGIQTSTVVCWQVIEYLVSQP